MKDRPFYGVNEPIGPVISLLGGIQHVLAMFVGIITPPLIIATTLALDVSTTGLLVSMALFTSGITTFIQVRRFGPVGSGLLSVQGTSFTFVPLAIQAGRAGGLPLIFSLTLAGSPVEMIISRFIHLARKLFPPVVTGSVVMLIGISLVMIGIQDIAGGKGAPDFGSFSNIGLGLFVAVVILLCNRFGRGFMSTVSIALGIALGYAVAAALGRVDLSSLSSSGWITVPQPLKYGLAFHPAYLVPWLIGYLVTSIETMGDLTASSAVSREPVEGPLYIRRLEGGVLADGIGSFLAGLFNAMPNTTFSQNNGVIALTGVASRRVGYAVAGILVMLGLCPQLAGLVSLMPKPVLGGATTIMFAMVAIAGYRIILSGGLNHRNKIILAVTLAAGVLTMIPHAFDSIGALAGDHRVLAGVFTSLQIILQSAIATGGIVAIIMNLVLPGR